MKRVALTACALLALVLNQAVAATAINGAPLDPRNLIADDLEAEALASYARNTARAPFRGNEIVIVDYRLPSSARRLYVVNLMTGAVEPHFVAHGKGSDPAHTNVALRFGDTMSSGMSSLGAYRGAARYDSAAHGPALRLQGLDTSNRSAYERAIVFHTAAYFDPASGRLGRSLGCFVVTSGERSRIYDVIADGGFLYAGPSCLGGGPGACRRNDNSLMASAENKPATPVILAAETPAPVALPVVAPVPVAAAPVVVAAVVAPATVAKVAPPPLVFADNMPAPRAKPRLEMPVAVAVAFNAPVPLAKPALDSDAQLAAVEEILGRRRAVAEPAMAIAFDVPEPLAKPAFAGMEVAAVERDTSDIPVPLLKPALDTGADEAVIAANHTVTGQADLVASADGIPLPQAKPTSFDVADAAPAVPATSPGEVPVPAPKPGSLRRVADAGIAP